jgi:hypothetical protein
MSYHERFSGIHPMVLSRLPYEEQLQTVTDLSWQTTLSNDPRLATALDLMPTEENWWMLAGVLTPESRETLQHKNIIALTSLLLRPDRTIARSDMSLLLDPLQREAEVESKIASLRQYLKDMHPDIHIGKINSGVSPEIVDRADQILTSGTVAPSLLLDDRYALFLPDQEDLSIDLSYGKYIAATKEQKVVGALSATYEHKSPLIRQRFMISTESRILLVILSQSGTVSTQQEYFDIYNKLTGTDPSADSFSHFRRSIRLKVFRTNAALAQASSSLHIIRTPHHLELVDLDMMDFIQPEAVRIREHLSSLQQLLYEQLQTSSEPHSLDELIQIVWGSDPSSMDVYEKRDLVGSLVGRLRKKLALLMPDKEIIKPRTAGYIFRDKVDGGAD